MHYLECRCVVGHPLRKCAATFGAIDAIRSYLVNCRLGRKNRMTRVISIIYTVILYLLMHLIVGLNQRNYLQKIN